MLYKTDRLQYLMKENHLNKRIVDKAWNVPLPLLERKIDGEHVLTLAEVIQLYFILDTILGFIFLEKSGERKECGE